MWTDGWTDRQTGMMKLIFIFRSFSTAPKKNCAAVGACTDGEVQVCVWKEGNCIRESINLNLVEMACEVD